MKNWAKRRRWILLLVVPLVATAALRANDSEQASRAEREAPARSSGTSRHSLAAAEAQPLPRLDVQRLQALSRRHVSEQPPVDPFAAEAMAPSASEQAAMTAEPPAPPPPPEAPALPFRFIGRQDADGVTLIFLEQKNETLIVHIGENVADGWRLETADDQALTFTYVPLGQQRRLATGSAG